MVEADPIENPYAVDDLLNQLGQSIGLRSDHVTHVELAATVRVAPDGPPKVAPIVVLPDVAHLCTYHFEQDRIKRTYNRSKQQAAQAEAWRLLGERLDLLARADAENVVPLKRRKA